MKLGFDIDGVLSNFERGFLPLLPPEIQEKAPAAWVNGAPATWDWPEALGATKEQISAAWSALKQDPHFWENLPPLPETPHNLRRLSALRPKHDIYFVTHRMGVNVKAQTEAWLARWGFPFPTVLVSADKSTVSRVLHLDAFIEDKPETLANWSAPETKLFVFDRPYNQGTVSAIRVKTVGEMLDRLGL